MINEAFGLSIADLNSIIAIFQKHIEVEEAIIFGSRAKGTQRTGSDVDIALKGKSITRKIINAISYELNEETRMPYKFDILDFNYIQNKDLVEHIERVGKVVYGGENLALL